MGFLSDFIKDENPNGVAEASDPVLEKISAVHNKLYEAKVAIENERFGTQMMYDRKHFLEEETQRLKKQNKYLSDELNNKSTDIANYQREVNKHSTRARDLEKEVVRVGEKVQRYKDGVEHWKKQYLDMETSRNNIQALNVKLTRDATNEHIEELKKRSDALEEDNARIRKDRNETLVKNYHMKRDLDMAKRVSDSYMNTNKELKQHLEEEQKLRADLDVEVQSMDTAVRLIAQNYAGKIKQLKAVETACDTGMNFYALRTMLKEILSDS